ncbi:MAG TPA: extracellular solute-binding protein [Solirubrobacteraceae bacterium]|jgi:multiple sugar transport system substrate-binding protein|nr:extracellular solute-binding protein [Solirubrobacteraceae bacterium]
MLTLAVMLAGASAAGCGAASSQGPVTLNWYVYPEPSGSFAYAASTCSNDSGGKYRIVMNLLSTASDQQRVSEVRRLAAGDPSIDILAMDVDWTAEYAAAKWILPWPAAQAAQVTRGDLPGPVATATWNGRLYAAPLNSNTELLWYRKDLLAAIHRPPPTTWSQMIDDSILLAKQGKPHYIEEQGSQYEGLTVWFNSMVDSAGGGILTKNDTIIVGPTTQVAASIMHRLATSPAADPSLNVTQEAQSETAFEHGTAAFQINYPFVWAAAHKDTPSIGKEMGYALFPRVNPAIAPRVSIGGYNLGVSSFSQHPQLAFDAVKCMIQPQFQRRDAIKGGLAPVQASIYGEPAFAKAYPFHAQIKAQLEHYGIRPQTPVYADVTLAIQKALSPTASINPTSVVSTLGTEIKAALSSEALL